MKISMKRGDKELNIDADITVYLEDISEFVVKINKELFGDSSSKEECSGHCSCHADQSNQNTVHSVNPSEKNEFAIRKRLPNNVVDLSELTFKKATTESALVRCPHCGQSHAIIVKDGIKLFLMKRCYDTDEFSIVAEFSSENEEEMLKYLPVDHSTEKILDYFYEVHSRLPLPNKDFNVSNDSEIFCPVCGQSADFSVWKDAYANKERYFEQEYICGACGGECLMDAQSEKDGKSIVECSRCGKRWAKEQL